MGKAGVHWLDSKVVVGTQHNSSAPPALNMLVYVEHVDAQGMWEATYHC